MITKRIILDKGILIPDKCVISATKLANVHKYFSNYAKGNMSNAVQ